MRPLLCSLLLASCTVELDTDDPADADCAERTDGAFVTFDVAGESFTTWVTDDGFIDRAVELASSDETQVPVFHEVIEGGDCADPQWRFRVDPADVSFADVTIELCDARPSYVDENLESWIDEVGQWCPWSAVVTEVEDRR